LCEDLLAIPNYYGSDVVEGFGLVQFRETSLFFADQYHTLVEKQKVSLAISFALVHFVSTQGKTETKSSLSKSFHSSRMKWFGNLVASNWWSDTWLNEGMASYLKYKAVDYVHYDWKIVCET
jgi:glutamyl aminopeptidase